MIAIHFDLCVLEKQMLGVFRFNDICRDLGLGVATPHHWFLLLQHEQQKNIVGSINY